MKHVFPRLSLTVMILLAACTSPAAPIAVSDTPPQPTDFPIPSATAPAPETEPALLSTLPPVQESPPTPQPSPTGMEIYALQREVMVEEGVIAWGVEDAQVIEAMRTVPRHEFVPEEVRSLAYENHPLPIGYGQTISQPYIVALMTQAADVSAGDQVLEIGTGSGYQAAVLAQLVDQVHSIEIIPPLAERAEDTLSRLGYDNVKLRRADGYFGWEEEGPFDAIVVTAAPDHIPQPLVKQLKIGGRMIIPVGPVGGFQTLWLITRISEEEIQTQDLGGVSFVPLTREES